MKNSIDIHPEHLNIVQVILKKYLPAHTTVWVFGSRAKGTARKFSDLDLAMDAGKPLDSLTMAQIAFDFEESDLPYKVDIVDWLTIKENFRNLIMQDRVVIWKS